MKIVVMINDLIDRNGAQIFVVNLCKELNNNLDVELYLISIYGSPNDSFLSELHKHGIAFLTLDKHKRIDFKASRKLKRILNNIQPDILNMHLSCLPTYFLGFGFRKQKFRIIQTFHTFPHKELNILSNIFIKKRMITYIGISNEITTFAKKQNKNIDCTTINNGIPLTVYNHYANNKKKYDFIIVASMTEAKNHKLLFFAFSEVVKKFSHIKLLCVGGGPLLNENIQYVKKIGIEQNVEFTGEVSSVDDYLLSSRCFVLASNREGNPISILEAMNAGLPIISPRIGGIPDIVKIENGFLFDADSKEQLKALLIKAIEEKELFKSVGIYNINYAKQFDIKNTAIKYLEYFDLIINEGK